MRRTNSGMVSPSGAAWCNGTCTVMHSEPCSCAEVSASSQGLGTEGDAACASVGSENSMAALDHYTQLKTVYVEMGEVACGYR